MPNVTIRDIIVGNGLPFTLIAGPCQIESRAHASEMADALTSMARAMDLPLIYKSSFDKANRTSATTARGVGMSNGLDILAAVREQFGIPVLTDVHDAGQCAPAAQAVDVLQIPAFLCRQTDLLLAAGETGAAINVKKGQFLAPWDMQNVAAKVASTGNQRILLTERGASFGYNTLVDRLPFAADHGRHRLPGGVRRHPFGPATRRPRHQQRGAARVRPYPGPCRPGGGGRCRVHRVPPRSGPCSE